MCLMWFLIGCARLRLFELFPVLLGILLSWFIAWLLTIGGAYNSSPADVQAACRTDQSNVLFNSPWFRFPYPGQWGPIHITWASTLTMLAGEEELFTLQCSAMHLDITRLELNLAFLSLR